MDFKITELPAGLDEPMDYFLKIESDTGAVRVFRADLRMIRPARSPLNLFLPFADSVRPLRLFEKITWDGRDDSGKIVADGTYRAQVVIFTRGGASQGSNVVPIQVNTRRPQLQLNSNARMLLRPVGLEGKPADSINGLMTINQIATAEAGTEFVGRILDVNGNVIEENRWSGSLVSPVTWNGKNKENQIVPWGSYSYRLSARTPAGIVAEMDLPGLLIVPELPFIDIQPDEAFSPNGDSQKDKLQILLTMQNTASRNGLRSWKIEIFADSKPEVAIYEVTSQKPMPGVLVWDGLDKSGSIVRDGVYRVRLTLETVSGTFASFPRSFRVDTKAPDLDLSPGTSVFSPDGDGDNEELPIRVSMKDDSGIDAWSLRVLCTPQTEKRIQRLLKSWQGGTVSPESIVWNGIGDNGESVESLEFLTIWLEARDRAGNLSAPRLARVSTDILLRPVVPGQQALISRIPVQQYFDSKAELTSAGDSAISNLLSTLNRYRRYQVSSFVNSGIVGSEEDNLDITERRSYSVFKRMEKSWPSKLKFQGLGESEILSTAPDDFTQYRNERIELQLVP
ncbi:MAG: hypothetical protein K8S54_17200 [Spirochaetia bacterium]|nr:hypothetical protein [Spirochaetia bacterium]